MGLHRGKMNFFANLKESLKKSVDEIGQEKKLDENNKKKVVMVKQI